MTLQAFEHTRPGLLPLILQLHSAKQQASAHLRKLILEIHLMYGGMSAMRMSRPAVYSTTMVTRLISTLAASRLAQADATCAGTIMAHSGTRRAPVAGMRGQQRMGTELTAMLPSSSSCAVSGHGQQASATTPCTRGHSQGMCCPLMPCCHAAMMLPGCQAVTDCPVCNNAATKCSQPRGVLAVPGAHQHMSHDTEWCTGQAGSDRTPCCTLPLARMHGLAPPGSQHAASPPTMYAMAMPFQMVIMYAAPNTTTLPLSARL